MKNNNRFNKVRQKLRTKSPKELLEAFKKQLDKMCRFSSSLFKTEW